MATTTQQNNCAYFSCDNDDGWSRTQAVCCAALLSYENCCKHAEERKVTGLWYFWTVLGVLLLVVIVSLVRCLKRRAEVNRVIRMHTNPEETQKELQEKAQQARGLKLIPLPESNLQHRMMKRVMTPYPGPPRIAHPASIDAGIKPLDPAYVTLTSRAMFASSVELPGYISQPELHIGSQNRVASDR